MATAFVSQYPLEAYASADLINLFLPMLYESEASVFQGAGSTIKYFFTYNAQAAPIASLNVPESPPPPSGPYNIVLDFSAVEMKVFQDNAGNIGPLLFDVTPAVTAYAMVEVTDGNLSLTAVTAVVEGGDFGDQLLTEIVNGWLIPEFQTTVQNIELPQLQNIFGTTLSGGVGAGTVIGDSQGDALLQVGAVVAGASGLSSADDPSEASLEAIASSSSGTASILGIISANTINFVLPSLIGPQSMPFTKESTSGLGGIGIRGTLYITSPTISIVHGSASVTANVSTTLDLGMEILGSDWNWSPVSVPDVIAIVDFDLETDGQTASLHLTGVERISVTLDNWPSVFKPVANEIVGLLDLVVNAFDNQIGQALSQVYVPLFNLPQSIPGTNTPANLSFASNGLGFYEGSVQALIIVTA